MKKWIKILIKTSLWIILSCVGLFLIVFTLLQIPQVQNALTSKAIRFVQNRIDSEVDLGHINIAFPKSIVLSDIYLEDLQGDTLLFCRKLKVDINMLALAQKKIQINDVQFDQLTTRVRRNGQDSSFNFSFIIEAFADKTKQKGTTSQGSSWTFDIKDVRFEQSHLSYDDHMSGLNANLSIGNFRIATKLLRLDTFKLHFDNILLENTTGKLVLSGNRKSDTSSESTIPDIGFEAIDLYNVTFKLQDAIEDKDYTFNVGSAAIKADDMDLPNSTISLNELKLSDSRATIFSGSVNTKTTSDTSEPFSLDFGWNINMEELDLDNIELQLNQSSSPPEIQVVDFDHLELSSLNSRIEGLKLDKIGIRLNIKNMSFEERSGFRLDQLASNIKIDEHSANISDLFIQTGQSNIELNLQMQYPDIQTINAEPERIKFDFELGDTEISLIDLERFVPGIRDSIPLNLGEVTTLTLSSKAQGSISDFNVRDFALNIGSDTELTAEGNVAGLPDTKQIQFDVESRLNTTSAFLSSILPDSVLRPVDLPPAIEVTGKFSGAMSDFKAVLDLNTNYGNLLANIDLKEVLSSAPGYVAEVQLKEFDLGKILRDTTNLGRINLDVKGEGSGFEIDQMNSSFDVHARLFEYRDYAYKDFEISLQVRDKNIEIDSDFDDPNLAFTIDGSIDLKKPDRAYDLKFDLKKAYLNNLHLTREELKMQTKIDVNLEIGSLRQVNGDLNIRDFAIYKNETLYRVDSFLVASINQEKKKTLNVHSDIMEAEFDGNMSILDLGKTLKQHFNKYYTLPSVQEEITNDQNFDFYIDVKNTDLITEVLFPQLSKFDPGKIEGSYNSAEKRLDFQLKIPLIGYNKAVLDSLVLSITSDKEKLIYDLSVAELKDSIFHINQLAFNGEIRNDSLSTDLVLRDTLSEEKYRFGGTLSRADSVFTFRFHQEGLKFNYKKWQLPRDHFLQFGKDGFTAHNFSMSNQGQQLTLKTENKDLNISFDQFHLEALSGLVEGRKRIFEGMVNGEVMLRDTNDFTSISADLVMAGVRLRDGPIGEINIRLKNKEIGRYDGEVLISGDSNQLKASGFYAGNKETPEMKLDLNLSQLNLSTVEVFVGKNISHSSGYLTGNASISRTLRQPQITGEIIFKEAAFEVDYLGTKIHADDQSIVFDADKVILDDFVLRDVNDQSFHIDGTIDIRSLLNPVVDLNINADDFLALNTTSQDNDLYYGKLILDTQTSLDGPLNELDISMNVDIGEGSHFTYVVPSAQKGSMERKEIMRFVDKDQKKDEFLGVIEDKKPDDTLQAPLGLDVNAIISMDSESSLEIVIDPVAGDRLQLQGNANLSLGINPSGDVSLTGQYEISDGFYIFSFYGIVKKEFDVRKGSNLTWFGDVLDADVDVTATYAVEAAPIDLMQSQVSENTESSIYNKKLPFTVELNMEGKLLRPDISFDLGIEDRAKSYAGGAVYGKIQSINQIESEVNKQVFALLILNRFIANNPFASVGGTTEGLVRTSVSRLLSEQLSKLTDQIDGLDINVGLKSYEDYSAGERQGRTDLNLGLSTDILNDRVTVKVAGNITLEGAQQEQKNLSDIAGDVSLEYKLTEDGRFRIVTFRKEVYEALLQGEIIETGAGFIMVEDFDKFGEIFKRRGKKTLRSDEQ